MILNFKEKAALALDLYAGYFRGRPPSDDDYVLCFDEKPRIQARQRCHPVSPPAPGVPVRVEHEYSREGVLQYLAAWDVHRGKVHGRCVERTGIAPFLDFVAHVMAMPPYRRARRVFWIVDNGSSHRGDRFAVSIEAIYSNLILVNLPNHASWLSQVEIYFSIVQRKVLSPNYFHDLDALESALMEFESLYNRIAKPFGWQFTRKDLDQCLRRIA